MSISRIPLLQPLPLKEKTPTDTSRLFSYSTYSVAVNYYVLRPKT